MIGVSSILNQFQGTNIYLHFQKLGYNPQRYASITIVPFGDEPWIPLSSAVNGGAVNGRFIRFRFPVKSLFYSADHPNGATPGTGIQVTFWGADDVQDGIFVRRG
jgi:hypothetical protein